MKKPKHDFSSMDVDEFLNDFDVASADSGSEDEVPVKKATKKVKKAPQVVKKTKTEKVSKKKKTPVVEEKPEESSDEGSNSDADSLDLDEDDCKEGLKKLKDIDPEFYQYLEQNDKKLLKFGAEMDDASDSDEEEEDDDQKSADEGEDDDEKPDLEVASDESDYDHEDGDGPAENVVTLKLLKQWQAELMMPKPKLDTLRNVSAAFHCALLSISEDATKQGKFVVEGSAAFNGVLQLCILNFEGALKRFLGIDVSKKSVQKCKKFKKVSSMLRIYILDISNLLQNVASANILTVLLKHLHQLAPIIQAFSSLTKPILKRLITLWSSSEETTRILAFLCILKITRQQQPAFLNNVLKFMYLSYVKNCRFVSPTTLPNINFMRRSLIEMFALDLTTAYQHAFLYIRQLAIHLRNAVTLKHKESYQAVCNWQYINSLRMWVDFLSLTHNKPQMEPLIYPLVTIITGVIKLVPTVAFFPLRFHCCRMLADLSRETKTYIPIMPYVLEVLEMPKFNETHKKLSMKPMKFTAILRVSQAQLDENYFRDEVVENVYGIGLQVMSQMASSVAFPDFAVMPLTSLKAYVKSSKNANYNRKIKQLIDKIQENVTFIENERKSLNCQLKDFQAIGGWEATVQNKGPPLVKAFEEYAKTMEKKKRREAADTDTINATDLPTMKKNVGANKKRKSEGPVELFPESSGDEDEMEIEKPKPKKQKKENAKKAEKKEKKTKNKIQVQTNDTEEVEDTVDIVEDLNMDLW